MQIDLISVTLSPQEKPQMGWNNCCFQTIRHKNDNGIFPRLQNQLFEKGKFKVIGFCQQSTYSTQCGFITRYVLAPGTAAVSSS